MSGRSSIFDMIGPVMIGPSSSHTAGVVRIGRVARRILNAPVEKATITFYNSFARTYEGHGSDRAILAGLMDFETHDERIRTSPEIAAQSGLAYTLRSVSNASQLHPNSIRIEAEGGGRQVRLLGISRGGGLISITEVNGFHCNFTAQLHTLIITANDVKGSIAFIATVVANDNANIASMSVDRTARDQVALHVLEMDSGIQPITLDYLRHLTWIEDINYLPQIDM
jgi:L-serine dehydratase